MHAPKRISAAIIGIALLALLGFGLLFIVQKTFGLISGLDGPLLSVLVVVFLTVVILASGC